MVASALVDSNFFIDRMRRGEDPFSELAEYADEWEFATCGVVVAEVLRGMKIKSAHQRVQALMGCMIYLPTLNSVWERVASLAWHLDRKGRTIQIPDLIIAACALEVDVPVLTFDSDFAMIPNLRVIDRLT